ncbi:hypothetical protein [Bradyrhizobium japonicum]|uniref:hypothetical protein n=1 Tax=Bradyrhizobium japonicum TaxID=375 RepID=UPI001BAC194B|nr:hypothetical protein [Bradyrhizobium japonicum]MBR0960033.1 hypothetical protein [Bradyrhizobium japonicum]
MALEIADHGYVMETGRIVLGAGPSSCPPIPALAGSTWVSTEVGSRESYRDVKRHKRRKHCCPDWCSGFDIRAPSGCEFATRSIRRRACQSGMRMSEPDHWQGAKR